MLSIFKKIIPSKGERDLKKFRPVVESVNALEGKIRELSDLDLKAKTGEFLEKLDNGASIDDILVEAFAVCREAGKRALGLRHFDCQIMGGTVLYQGKIAEMKTGEGKTLVATLPIYLYSLQGRGAHLVTVNDYLAKRDAEWMGEIYKFLGRSVGIIQHGCSDEERKAAYARDITYGTNNEYGFDFLRDNMKFELEDQVQRDLGFCVVDEVDSILIDEARTPLIISGPTEETTDKYTIVDKVVPRLKKETDFTIDEKARSVTLTEEGVSHAEKLLGVPNLYDPKNMDTLHHLQQSLKAHNLFKKDIDYVVKDNEVLIVDEFTGRLMPGRRYSDGLHQALEAKENVKIENENQTLASITFQNYFRMFDVLSGMTGTADTEAVEFKKIYDLDVVVIPTNKPLTRVDFPDVIYRTEKEKFHAIVDEILEYKKAGRPVLVGTISIENSEKISNMLKRSGVKHSVLNAKHHEQEAEIVSMAGQRGCVTIATNMAGRGTDIVLGEGVADLGGLHIIGTERHESRRIDNQLRGRAGRQGDPGSSRFFLSLQDDLLRIFGSDKISGIMLKMGMEEGEPIEHGMISKAIENAQKKVEGRNFDMRKQLLDYDDVMNKQRDVVYKERQMILKGREVHDVIFDMLEEQIENIVELYTDDEAPENEWDYTGIRDAMLRQFAIKISFRSEEDKSRSKEELEEFLKNTAKDVYKAKEAKIGEEGIKRIEKMIMLQVLDDLWKDHLYCMDQLKEGIGLRGYGQKDPKHEYQREGFDMFTEMEENVKKETLAYLFSVQVELIEEEEAREAKRRQKVEQQLAGTAGINQTYVKKDRKIGRNDPCSCGSGKKFKKCCGK